MLRVKRHSRAGYANEIRAPSGAVGEWLSTPRTDRGVGSLGGAPQRSPSLRRSTFENPVVGTPPYLGLLRKRVTVHSEHIGNTFWPNPKS